MTEMTVRHSARLALNDEAVASHEILLELLRNHIDAIQLAARARATRRKR